MKTLIKYLLLVVVSALSAPVAIAQDSAGGGEVVMTKAQLQSFLTRIAQLKREQMAKQRETKLQQGERRTQALSRLQDARSFSYSDQPDVESYNNRDVYQENKQSAPAADQKILTQLELLNAKLNAVMSEMEVIKLRSMLNNASGYNAIDNLPVSPAQPQPQSARSVQQEPRAGQQTRLQPVIINQGTPSQPYVISQAYPSDVPQSNLTLRERSKKQSTNPQADSALFRSQQEQMNLSNRIHSLEGELQLLQQLKSGSDTLESTGYNDQISSIRSQIEALHEQLTQRTAQADSVIDKKDNNLLNLLRDFSYKVYFENNSIAIPPGDYSKLQDVVRIAQNNPEVTVVLRGFASKSGNARYNEKISLERATSVKEYLLKSGLSPDHIMTMHHGVDASVDASRARRVEISFRIQ